MGFSLTVFTSPYLEHLVERVALNAKMGSVMGMEQITTMVAASFDRRVRLMGFTEVTLISDFKLTNQIIHEIVMMLFV